MTTAHPDRWRPDRPVAPGGGDPIVIQAPAQSAPDDIVNVLTKLNDQVRAERLSQKALETDQYWRSWVRVFETGCHLFDKVKLTVSARFVSVETTGICH